LREGNQFYVSGPGLEAFTEPTEIRNAALQLIDEFYGVGLLMMPSMKKPSIGKIVREDDNGKRAEHFVLQVDGVEIRSKAGVVALSVNGQSTQASRPTEAQKLRDGARADVHLQTSIMLWADPPRSWPRLYRILEEVEASLGQPVGGERERFKRSANSGEVAGKDARHRRGKFQPPKNPMSLDEANGFVASALKAACIKLPVAPATHSGEGAMPLPGAPQVDKTHHALYVALHAARSTVPDLWSDQQCTHVLSTVMGRRSWSWLVVGITPAALDALAAVGFHNRKELGLVRAHLVNRIHFVRHLMHLPQPASYDYFASYWTANDRTVLALRSENGRDGFPAYLPFDAPGLFSSERLAGWAHGKAERAFLRTVHAQRPAPVALGRYPALPAQDFPL
jgi:hypothetical protein